MFLGIALGTLLKTPDESENENINSTPI